MSKIAIVTGAGTGVGQVVAKKAVRRRNESYACRKKAWKTRRNKRIRILI